MFGKKHAAESGKKKYLYICLSGTLAHWHHCYYYNTLSCECHSFFDRFSVCFHRISPFGKKHAAESGKKKYLYMFEEGNKDMRELLGGKGANP